MRDTLLVFGLLLSTASQLRPATSALGPGEICLAIWLVLTLCRTAGQLGSLVTPALSRLLVFWALFALAQSLGVLLGLAIEDNRDPDSAWHDIMAYLLLAAVSCMSVAERGAELRLRRVARLLTVVGTASLALQLADAWGLVDIPQIDPWFWDRMRGWSDNPNQLALLCVVLGLLALHLAETGTRLAERIAASACSALAFYVGLLTGSDSLTLVLLAVGPIFIALKFRTFLLPFEQGLTFRVASAWIAILALPLVLASAAPFGPSIAAEAKRFATGMFEADNDQGAMREILWNEAINRGLESGMIGLGPGGHLVTPLYKRPPPPNFEAHNTFLDLFTQGGLIAVLSFVWLAATALLITYRARLVALTTLLCGLGIFAMFHLIVRHPIFWFAIALCLVAGEGAKAAPVRDGT